MRKPCKECPFKKTSAPGYLGTDSYKPAQFVQSIDHEIFPCHMTVDYDVLEEDEFLDSLAESEPCVGALHFMANQGALPRDKEYAALVREAGKNENVFNYKGDFIKYHSNEDV